MKPIPMRWAAFALSLSALLSACGGEGGDMPSRDALESQRQSLLFAYPDDGQADVATPSPVVLRFTSAVSLANAQDAVTLHEGSATGAQVQVSYSEVADEPRGLVLTPVTRLKPLTQYTVVVNDLALAKGMSANRQVSFTTRGLNEGPKALTITDEAFILASHMPDGSALQPVMDLSTFRLRFSQPIEAVSARYGEQETVALYNQQGDLVDARLLVSGAYMTVDPVQEYLTAGETYTLSLGSGLRSVYGEVFAGQDISFTPADSSPRGEPARLVQALTNSADGALLSPLTGLPVNQVPVNGTLLGTDVNLTQASAAALIAELGDVTVFPEVTPLRIPAGTLLDGSAINVMIGGQVPAGFSSGPVAMQMVSDATGYLVPNPYNSQRDDALRIVRLFMDIAISTGGAEANAAFTQSLLHIELVGTARVDTTTGTLNIDAVSVVEPAVLGLEYGYGLLSFQLQSYPDQTNPPQPAPDMTAPTLQSWLPGARPETLASDAPIVLNFSEAIDPASVSAGLFSLTEVSSGASLDINVQVDGGAVIIHPSQPWQPATESQPGIAYQLQVAPGLTDFAGNGYVPDVFDSFALPLIVEEKVEYRWADSPTNEVPTYLPAVRRAPIILAVYPGFPCVLDVSAQDLAAGIAGACLGALSELPGDGRPVNDLMPLTALPANKPVLMQFTKDIDAASVTSATFFVEQVDSLGNGTRVPGRADVSGKRIVWWPDQPWQAGALYRYVLVSSGDRFSATVDCAAMVCSTDGMPVQTQVYAMSVQPDSGLTFVEHTLDDAGGPDFVQYFRGAEASNTVLQALAGPSQDANANLWHEVNEVVTDENVGMATSIVSHEYAAQEQGVPDDQPLDPHACEDTNLLCNDPAGLLPPVNSAKIVSLVTSDPTASTPITGTQTGCGYGPDEQGALVPLVCPKQKFVYLTAALTAEITDEFVPGKGLRVNIWPGQIMTTSIRIRNELFGFMTLVLDSGPQMMRMRFAKDDETCVDAPALPCPRSQPISGWLAETADGPTLSASVDIYVDAFGLQRNLDWTAIGIPDLMLHGLMGYPATLDLTGKVSFQENGRMSIEQYNTNGVPLIFPVAIEMPAPGGLPFGMVSLQLPAYGSRLELLSDSIK